MAMIMAGGLPAEYPGGYAFTEVDGTEQALVSGLIVSLELACGAPQT